MSDYYRWNKLIFKKICYMNDNKYSLCDMKLIINIFISMWLMVVVVVERKKEK